MPRRCGSTANNERRRVWSRRRSIASTAIVMIDEGLDSTSGGLVRFPSHPCGWRIYSGSCAMGDDDGVTP